MAQRLNKNLVAFLTVMGILLTVAIVGIATFRGAQRDPEVYAEAARKFQASGEYERALEQYMRAYGAARRREPVEVKYLVEASNCAYSMGEVEKCLQYLETASAQRPDVPGVKVALLERLWELRDYNFGNWLWEKMRDTSKKLLEIEPNNILALVSRSVALRELGDAATQSEADELLKKAAELGEGDPRVALTLARADLRSASELQIKKRDGTAPANVDQQIAELRQKASARLEAAIKANPADYRLVGQYFVVLMDGRKVDEARVLLEQGIAANPKSSELRAALGNFLVVQVAEKGDKLDPAERRKLIDEATASLKEAIKLDASIYQSHIDLARAQLLNTDANADKAADVARRYKAALDIYDEAIRSTVGLRTLRAMVSSGQRLILMFEGFRTARQFQIDTADPELEKFALDKARKYANDAKTQAPDAAITYVMLGELALADNDTRAAIQAFLRAEEQAKNSNLMISRLANEQLALLYGQTGQFGAALKYVQAAMQLYTDARQAPPIRLVRTHGEMLLQLDRAAEARTLLEELHRAHPEDRDVTKVLADAYLRLKMPDKAKELLGQLGGDETGAGAEDVALTQARIAVSQKDYATAEPLIRATLEKSPDRIDLMRFLVGVMVAAERRDECRQFLQSISGRMTKPESKRMEAAFEVVLSTTDEAERNKKLLDIIEQIPDEEAKLSELFGFYVGSNQPEKAQECLDRFEKLKPNSRLVLEQQFQLALQRKQLDRAAQYVAKLAQINADGAGGSRYRGRLAIERGDYDAALRELTAARTALPNDSDLLLMLAASLIQVKPARHEEAMSALDEALRINPNQVQAHKLAYEISSRLGQNEKATPHLLALKRLAPGDPFVKERAQVIDEEQDPRAGIARREELLKTKPDDVENLRRLSYLCARSNDFVKAEQYLQAAAKADPANFAVADLAIDLYVALQKPADGEAFILRHIGASSKEGKVRATILLARFYEAINQLEQAREAYERCATLAQEAIEDPKDRFTWKVESGFQLVEFLHRVRRYEDVITACQKLIGDLGPQADPEMVKRARRRLADAQMRVEKFGDAEKTVAQFTQDFPKDASRLEMQAKLQLLRNKYEDARATLTQLLQERPTDSWAFFQRGSVNMQLRNYNEAREDLNRAKQLTTREGGEALSEIDVLIRVRLAAVYELLGQAEQAEARLMELMAAQPTNLVAATNLLRIYRGQGRLEKSQQFLSDAITKAPGFAFFPYQLGLVLMDRSEFGAAALQFKQALDLTHGKDPVAIASWLHALVKAGKAADATKGFEGLAEEVIAPDVRVGGGEAYLTVGQKDKAVAQFERSLLEASRTSFEGVSYVANRIAELQGWEQVTGMLRKLAEAPAPDADTGYRLRTALAMCLVSTGGSDEAKVKAAAQEAAKLVEPVCKDAPERSAERVRALLILGQVQSVLDQKEPMLATYEQVLREDPKNLQGLNNLAFYLADYGRPQEAMKYAERLVTLESEDSNVHDTVGWVFMLNGKMGEAEAQFKEAIRLDANNPAPYVHLGQLLAKAGKSEDARAELQKGLDKANKRKDAEYSKKAQEGLNALR